MVILYTVFCTDSNGSVKDIGNSIEKTWVKLQPHELITYGSFKDRRYSV